MTKEFENLLELLNSDDKGNNILGFNVAQNYKKEFKEYFSYSPKMYELIYNGINKWIKNVNSIAKATLPVSFIYKITLEIFAEKFLGKDFYDRRFSANLQCGEWKQLKNQVEQKVKRKDLDLTGIHAIIRPHLKKHWYFISKLNIENNK